MHDYVFAVAFSSILILCYFYNLDIFIRLTQFDPVRIILDNNMDALQGQAVIVLYSCHVIPLNSADLSFVYDI